MSRFHALWLALASSAAFGQIVQESIGTVTYTSAGTPNTINIDNVDAATGNLQVTFCLEGFDPSGVPDIVEAGWGNAVTNANTAGSDSSIAVEVKVDAGAESADVQCDMSNTGGSVAGVGGVSIELSSVHGDIYDVASVDCGDQENTATYPVGDCTITTVTDNARVCYVAHKDGGGSGTNDAAGWTNVMSITDAAQDANSKMSIGCQDKATAGAVTLSSGAVQVGGSNADWGGILIAFKYDAGDMTAPTLSNPTASSITDSGVTPQVDTDEANGTLYMVVVPDADTPSVAQIKAGQQSSGAAAIASDNDTISATGTHTFAAVTGLDASTSYELYFVHTDAASNDSTASTVGFTTNADSTAPTLTNPTASTITSSGVTPQVDTDEDNGTMYMVVVPDADSPSVAQIKAGQQSDSSPAIASDNDAISATGTHTFAAVTGLTSSTSYELFFVHTDAATNDSSSSTVGFTTAAGGSGVFDTNPSVSTQSDTAYTSIPGSLDATGNADAVLCTANRAAPDATEIEAGNCRNAGDTGTEAALATDTENPTMTPWDFDLGTLTPASYRPRFDIYTTDRTSVVALAGEYLDVPTGKTRCILTSIASGSPAEDIGAAIDDVLEIDNTTSPNSYTVNCELDGSIWYDAMGDTSRQTVGGNNQDISAETFTAYTFVFNNQAPNLIDPGEWPLEDALFAVNTDPAFNGEDYVEDFESDDLTWTVESGALPTDWVLGAMDGTISDGTPGACGDSTFTLRATDIYGEFLDLPSVVTIGGTVPNVVDVAEATAVTTIEAICSLTAVDGGDQNHPTIAAGNVISTDFVAGTVVEPNQAITYIVSLGPADAGGSDIIMRLLRQALRILRGNGPPRQPNQ